MKKPVISGLNPENWQACFYINIAQEIGINNQSADSSATHPSIQAIKENSPQEGYGNFDFEPVSGSQVLKIINPLSSKKQQV